MGVFGGCVPDSEKKLQYIESYQNIAKQYSSFAHSMKRHLGSAVYRGNMLMASLNNKTNYFVDRIFDL